MIKVRGIYDGTHVRLLEDLDVPPETEVEVLVPEPVKPPQDGTPEDEYWRSLREAGLVLERPEPRNAERDFKPIEIRGEPLSKTVLDNRR